MGDRSQAQQFYQAAIQTCGVKDNPEHLTLAYQLFASAVVADPTWWETAYYAGNNNSDLEHLPAAIACWRRALECDPEPMDRAKILTNLGWRLHCLGQEDEALQVSLEAIELDPSQAYTYINLALITGIADRSKEALDYARKAWALRPEDPIVEMCLGFSLMFDGQWAEGLKHHEARFPYKLKNYLNYPYPKWLGEPDKTVFVVADQGLGDTLTFARFLPLACERSKAVYAYVQSEAMRTFMHAFSHLPNLSLMPTNTPFPPADHWTTFMSLPFALKLNDEQIRNQPNYKMFEGRDFPQNWKIPDRKVHIGCNWAGSDRNEINKHRSFPVEILNELYRVPGVQLYSLQVGERAGDMHNAGMAPVMRDLTPYVRCVSNTTALMRDLDLIIACESACAHIAALANVPCWVPYSYFGRDWRAGHRGEDRLWTPLHRFFRQEKDCKWEPVFEKIVEALRERVESLSADQQAA